jgi:ABC-type protease/lipase transport system fused ATPase/permease subunit
MSERFKKGDLVLIRRSKPEKIGIVLEILRRSSQNSDWDSVLVMCDGDVDEFSPRKLLLKKSKTSVAK